MKKAAVLGLCLAILFMSGCATTVKLKVKRAPELNLGDAKTLVIEPFAVSGSLELDGSGNTGGSGLLGMVSNMASSAASNKIGELAHPGIQKETMNGYKLFVTNDGYYQLIEDASPDARVVGRILYNVRDSGYEREIKKKDGSKYKEYKLERTANVTVYITAKDKNGKEIGTAELTKKAYAYTTQSDKNAARSKIKSWPRMVKDALIKTYVPFLHKIAPYYITEQRTFEDGESPVIKEGNKAATKDDWKLAAQLWKQGASGGTIKDQTAAAYNQGIYAEVDGRLADALSHYDQAQNISGSQKYKKDIARIQTRIEEEIELSGK
jgi:uncharacterized protein DUF6340